MGKFPYSYHTFVFPFIWNDDGKISMEKFEEVLNKDFWKPTNWNTRDISKDSKEYLLDYATYQYFNNPVCDVIFGIGNDKKTPVVKNYSFNEISNKSKYIIKKDKHEYSLSINQISLSIYNTGIAVMVYETEYNPDDPEKRTMDDVRRINQLGRRISAAYLPEKGRNDVLYADYLGIRLYLKGKKQAVGKTESDDLVEYLFENDFKKDLINNKKISLNYVPKIVKGIISFSEKKCDKSKYGITSSKKPSNSKKKMFYISNILDDRMFVCCLVRDNKFAGQLKIGENINGKYEYSYETCAKDKKMNIEENIACLLYAFAFIDDGKEPSCMNREMMINILKKHVYDRWIEYGTVYCITHHSLVCVVEENLKNTQSTVINPFLTLYIKMAILVLVQRASIISFEREGAQISKGFEKKNAISNKNAKKIMSLHERYVAFKNQLLFFEVTAQEQGIELYDMMHESLYIKKETEQLESQLKNLYEASNIDQNIKTNKYLLFIAFGGLIVSLIQIFWKYLTTLLSYILELEWIQYLYSWIKIHPILLYTAFSVFIVFVFFLIVIRPIKIKL
ncbi:UNVERIFIED_CONTAM: hypothetical protein Cloal_2831 [Acetivibrio alkalicellulosi]